MIDIILASFNGEPFISEQVNSILAQTQRDWHLTMRDDKSCDRTAAICQDFSRRHPDRITLLEDSLGNLGFLGNFGRLIQTASRPYVMYCDQDDVWLPDKIERTLSVMREWESRLGDSTPLAVYTDAKVVDSQLNLISESLIGYIKRTHSTEGNLARICMAPPCYGCTMMFNRSLAQLIRGFPNGTLSHDWWTGLVASAFGRLVFAPCSPILHRRHTINLSTTSKSSLTRYLRGRPSIQAHRRALFRIFNQSEAFLNTFRHLMNQRQIALFTDIARIPTSNWLMRRTLIVRHGLYKTGFVKNAGMMVVV